MQIGNGQLQALMESAYQPCKNFSVCPEAKWKPEAGHIPRGILGATGALEDVEIVMVFAEPGHPHLKETYGPSQDPSDLLGQAMDYIFESYRDGTDLFHRNVRAFLDSLFPGKSFEEQLRFVWLTEGRLCSVENEIGGLRDKTCSQTFLVNQIQLFPNATVAAFGGKAQKYLKGLGLAHVGAYAMSPPGANRKKAKETWELVKQAVENNRLA